TKAFKTDESAPTPPSPRPLRARISVRLSPPMRASIEVRIIEYAFAATPPSLPPSLLSPWSSSLPQITSPPLPLPSPPTSPTYAEALLGYRAAMIRLRAASPPTHNPSEIPSPPLLLPSTAHRDDILDANMKDRHTLAHRVDYGFVDTVDTSIRASESRVMTAIGEDDRALLGDQVSILRRERRYFRSMASSYKHEAVIAGQAWSHSKNMPWRPTLELYRKMLMYYRDRGSEMMTD
ncbi:hypothetical protein Tco_1395974, partial [Tanacetum coccineum]